jgi:hypothetical protein
MSGLINIGSAVLLIQFYFLWLLIFDSSRSIAIFHLISNLAIFQWLIGPLVYYSDFNPGQVLSITQMQVSFEEYFAYAWPATALLVIGLQLSKPNLTVDLSIFKNADPKRFKFLIAVGLFFNIILIFLPLSLRFVVKTLTYLIYVGLLGLLLKEKKTKNDFLWVCGVSMFVVYSALRSAMFGELVFLILLFVLTLFYVNKTSTKRKLIIGISVILLGTSIQLVKMPLRELNRKGSTSTLQNLTTLYNSDLLMKENLFSDAFRAYTVARFNNGAVISYVINRVPNIIPYANGNTINSAIIGSFIPRLIWPTKETSGTAMYLKYTGLRFEGASYGISQLGEGYANFGKRGGILYMFLLGLTMSVLLRRIVKYINKNPNYFYFLPIIFLHGVKVETELNRSLGFMLRVIIVLYILNFILKKISGNRYYLY